MYMSFFRLDIGEICSMDSCRRVGNMTGICVNLSDEAICFDIAINRPKSFNRKRNAPEGAE